VQVQGNTLFTGKRPVVCRSGQEKRRKHHICQKAIEEKRQWFRFLGYNIIDNIANNIFITV